MFERVYLLTFDCLRADYLRMYNSSGVRAPNIERFAREGIIARKFFAGGGTTFSSFPTIHMSRYFFFIDGVRPDPFTPTVAEVLAKNGYYTIGVSSNIFLSKFFGWDKGFHEFFDELVPKHVRHMVIKKSAKDIIKSFIKKSLSSTLATSRFLSIMRKIRIYTSKKISMPYQTADKVRDFIENRLLDRIKSHKKIFLWVHFMDTHFPFYSDVWESYFEDLNEFVVFLTKLYFKGPHKVSDYELGFIRRAYCESIKFVDKEFGKLVDTFEENGLLENSLMIITADHGEELLDHGHFGHWRLRLYNELLRVPLVIRGGGGSVVRNVASTLDIAPTLLDLLKIRRPKSYWGANILKESNFRLYFAETAKMDPSFNVHYPYFTLAVIAWPWKLIVSTFSHSVELYNIEKDPHEKKNVVFEYNSLARELFKFVLGHINRSKKYRMKLRIIKRLKKTFCIARQYRHIS